MATRGRRRCADCLSRVAPPSTRQRVTGDALRRRRSRVLRRAPVCYLCADRPGDQVDHVLRHAWMRDRRLDPDAAWNLAGVCLPCHRRKTRLEREWSGEVDALVDLGERDAAALRLEIRRRVEGAP